MALTAINLRPTRRELRQFGFICLVAFGLLGGWLTWRRSFFGFDLGSAARTVAYVLWTIGGLSAVLSTVAPNANRPLYLALVLVTYPVGFVASHVILMVIFFGVITPLGVFFRIRGRDALNRRFDRDATSAWVPHRPPASVERYFRQF